VEESALGVADCRVRGHGFGIDGNPGLARLVGRLPDCDAAAGAAVSLGLAPAEPDALFASFSLAGVRRSLPVRVGLNVFVRRSVDVHLVSLL
jgi:hypothetical protein